MPISERSLIRLSDESIISQAKKPTNIARKKALKFASNWNKCTRNEPLQNGNAFDFVFNNSIYFLFGPFQFVRISVGQRQDYKCVNYIKIAQNQCNQDKNCLMNVVVDGISYISVKYGNQ